jgi:hypothetical protein
MSDASKAVREKGRNWRKHWTAIRSAVAHHEAFSRPNRAKGNRRHLKALKLAHTYRQFFADQARMREVAEHKIAWMIPLHPRMCATRF